MYMRQRARLLVLVSSLVLWGHLSAQPPGMLPESGLSARPTPPQVFGMERLAELMKPSASDASQGCQVLSSSGNSSTVPAFSFLGLDLSRTFQGNPHIEGNALLLQGELMIAIGEVLRRYGQTILDQAAGAAAQ